MGKKILFGLNNFEFCCYCARLSENDSVIEKVTTISLHFRPCIMVSFCKKRVKNVLKASLKTFVWLFFEKTSIYFFGIYFNIFWDFFYNTKNYKTKKSRLSNIFPRRVLGWWTSTRNPAWLIICTGRGC